MDTMEYIRELNEVLRKKGQVEYRLVDGVRCEFGCYKKQSGTGLPEIFRENGWFLREEKKVLKSGKEFSFLVVSNDRFSFLLKRTPGYLLIKPYSEDGKNRAGDEAVFERFRIDIEESGIGEVFCDAFPASSHPKRAEKSDSMPSAKTAPEGSNISATEMESDKQDWLNNLGEKFVLCDNDVADSKEIVNSLTKSGVFPVDISGILRARYEKMRENYLEDWKEKVGIWKQDGYDIVAGYEDALLSVPTDEKWGKLNEVCNLGHDLPIWCYYEGKYPDTKKAKRIMIVSQDPKRNGHNKGKLLLSSPWALHSRNYLEHGATLPKRIIHELLECGAIVYVTDFYKLYATNHSDEKEKNILIDNSDFAEKCKACLDAEIKAFKPDFMMIYGRDAEKGLFGDNIKTSLAGRPKRKYKTIDCFVVLHTNAHTAGTNEQKVSYYRNIFFPDRNGGELA